IDPLLQELAPAVDKLLEQTLRQLIRRGNIAIVFVELCAAHCARHARHQLGNFLSARVSRDHPLLRAQAIGNEVRRASSGCIPYVQLPAQPYHFIETPSSKQIPIVDQGILVKSPECATEKRYVLFAGSRSDPFQQPWRSVRKIAGADTERPLRVEQ